ncbi:hypothetical protein ACS0TY_016228 [Phlomoides rotata]
MRIPCCHTFLAFTLKFLNFLQAFVGVVVIVYSAYVLSKWNDLDASRPAPWFAYASMGIGILVFCISFIGHIGTEAMSGCCLCFYAILSTLFVLLEVGLVAFITLDHHWQEDILPDPTGELDNLRTFIQENMDVFEWIGIVILTIQACFYSLYLHVSCEFSNFLPYVRLTALLKIFIIMFTWLIVPCYLDKTNI